MNSRTTLYSYADSWLNADHSKTLRKTIKRTYLIKLLILTFALPFDVLYLLYINLIKKKFNVFFATEKWPNLTSLVSKKVDTANISSPFFLFRKFKSNAVYFPASIFYVPAAIGLFLPKSFHLHWTNVIVFFEKKLLKNFSKDKATIVVHSDALPFGRGLIMAANEVGIKSVCIQHGSFRDVNVIVEQDGFLCAHNIVRSAEDASIICKSNDKTKIHLLIDFFKLKIDGGNNKPVVPTVLLLGEGYHIVDKYFNEQYLTYLELMRDQFLKHKFNVVFRPHPSERNLRWNNRFSIVSNDPLQSCLSKVDAVIGYSSTLLQESAEIGIPTFYVDPLGDGHNITGRNGAIIHRYTDVAQLNQEITKKIRVSPNFEFVDNQSDSYEKAASILVE